MIKKLFPLLEGLAYFTTIIIVILFMGFV